MVGRHLLRFVVAMALLLAVSSIPEARAQGRGRGGRGMMGPQGIAPLTIAGNPAVQKELAVKPEQAEKLKDLAEDYNEELTQERETAGVDLRTLRDLPAEEQKAKRAQLAEVTKKVTDKFSPKLNDILDKTQRARLQEIAVQVAGAAALEDPTVSKELALTQEQKDKLAGLNKDFGEKMRSLRRDRGAGGGGAGGGGFTAIIEMRGEHLAKATEVLTKDQQAQFKKMQGNKFDVSQLMQRRGGGRRRGGNNN